MAYTKLPLKPGVFKDQSPLMSAGTYIDANGIRWRNGNAQIIGGSESTGGTTLLGKCRGIHLWADNNLGKYAAFGTSQRLYTMDADGTKYDNTPIIESSSLTSAFSSSIGSTLITVLDDNHGLVQSQKISFTSANTVGGVNIQGSWTVTSVLSTSSYTFTAASAATSTVTNVLTSAAFKYYLAPGQEDGLTGTGYGVGGYGLGGYGSPNTTYQLYPRTWSLDHWGQNLVAMPRGGNLYECASPTTTEASVISAAPSSAIGMFVTAERMIAIYGKDSSNAVDPLFIRWCSQENNRDWTSSAANTAGGFRLANGSRIVRGLAVGNENLIFTDTTVYRMRFVPDPSVIYAFDKLGDNCGLIGVNAVATIGGRAYWITPQGQFYEYTGGLPEPIPNPNQLDFFTNLSNAQQDKIFAFTVGAENEVWWLYPDIRDGNECSRYQIVDYIDAWWSVGLTGNTCHADAGIFQYPVGVSSAGTVSYMEKGYTANGGNLSAFLESAYVNLPGDGNTQYAINGMKPDFYQMQGGCTITLSGKYNPQSSITYTQGPFNINSMTERVDMRFQAAQIKFRIDWDSSPLAGQLGAMSFDILSTAVQR